VAEISESAREKLTAPNFAYLAIVDEKGPHVSPVWVDTDYEYVLGPRSVMRTELPNPEPPVPVPEPEPSPMPPEPWPRPDPIPEPPEPIH
jgi:hypothetical protein